MHAGAFAFYLFALAAEQVTYNTYIILRRIEGYEETAILINNIGVMTYFTASFIS
jgi:hypothetical protein